MEYEEACFGLLHGMDYSVEKKNSYGQHIWGDQDRKQRRVGGREID